MHTILNFIATVKPDAASVASLKSLLEDIERAEPKGTHPKLPFASLRGLHFASLVIFEDPPEKHNFDPYLVFENNFDGPFDAYLDELIAKAADGLHEIYSHCADYPAGGPPDGDRLRSFLRAHVVRPDAYHIGNTGRSVERVRRECDLKNSIETFLDAHAGQLASAPPASIRHEIQEQFESRPEWSWTRHVGPRMTFAERFVPWAKLVGVALLVLLLLPFLLPLLVVYLIVLRRHERTDRSEIPPPRNSQVQMLMSREDKVVQNHMASLCYVKPGRFRRGTLRFVLWATNLVARVSYKGSLSGLTTLHFAHWVLIDEGRRLLFLTNYDGSWENYLDDFVDRAALGLTGIWSNTEDFPRTKFLVFGGARDATRFKAIARHTQAFTDVWYSAYPALTVASVNNNSSISEELFGPLDETQTRRWLWRF